MSNSLTLVPEMLMPTTRQVSIGFLNPIHTITHVESRTCHDHAHDGLIHTIPPHCIVNRAPSDFGAGECWEEVPKPYPKRTTTAHDPGL